MKKILSFLIVFNFICFFTSKASNLDIIGNVSVETNYYYEGAKGIRVTYRYNFLSLEEEHHDDTLLNNCIFYIKTTLSENGNFVEPANGYGSVTNSSGDLEFIITLQGRQTQASKFDKDVSQFIPYAAMQLSEGSHTIVVHAEISGTDATGFLHQQKVEEKDIIFKKPATKLFTMNIDFVEVQTLNSNGQAWDYAIFKTDAPDVGINILVGNTSVWKCNVNDTYMFAVGPNSKNINFTISENDKVALLIQDIDIMIHDFVAKWFFSTSNKKDGLFSTYNTAKGNIKSCSLNFKIE
jgi:hypothetical protein